MNDWLAQMYGTTGAGEETQKLANVDLFCKLAADNNIDLSQLSQDEIGNLYAQVFPEEAMKLAEEEEKKDEEEEEKKKKELAAEHVEEKKAFQEKFAEADLMGRVMAHSFNQELALIKEAVEAQTPPKGWKPQSAEELAKGRAARQKKMKNPHAGWASDKRTPTYHTPGTAIDKSHMGTVDKGKSLLRRAGKAISGLPTGAKAGLIAGGAAAAGLAGAGIHKALSGEKKKAAAAQAFEELAAHQAIKIASAAGYDDDEAYTRVNAVYVLGLDESEKTAAFMDADDAIHVRGLEYLEAAGYPVDWSEIYGE